MTPEFWRDKRVLVTGHTGFKGGWLCMMLQSFGAKVDGLSLPPATAPSLFEVAEIERLVTSSFGDIRDAALVNRHIADGKFDVVFHLAAQSLVRRSYHDPLETYAVNVMGTAHLLEAVRINPGVGALIVVTSDKCYENVERSIAYQEGDPMGGHDPYSSSKGCAEILTASYRNSFFAAGGKNSTAIASVRAGNVIGGGDWSEDRLVPDLIRNLGEGQETKIRAPDAVRPWQHVLEPLAGYILLAERLFQPATDAAEAWNFGPNQKSERSVRDIADLVVARWGGAAGWAYEASDGLHEAKLLTLDSSKARSRLGWQPRWSLETAINRIVDWHKAHLSGASMYDHCLKDIYDYQNVNPIGLSAGK
jgi:CDP-glucose 4,6-dehydratase